MRFGLQPSEFNRLTPGEAKELLDRMQEHERNEFEGRMKLESEYVKTVVSGMNQIIKALSDLGKLIGGRPTL